MNLPPKKMLLLIHLIILGRLLSELPPPSLNPSLCKSVAVPFALVRSHFRFAVSSCRINLPKHVYPVRE